MAARQARASRDVWAKRVERWESSGQTAAAFARELGINARTLTYWRYALKRGAKPPRRRAGPREVPAASSFLKLEASASTEPFELELSGGRRLRVPASFDEAVLRRLLAILEAS